MSAICTLFAFSSLIWSCVRGLSSIYIGVLAIQIQWYIDMFQFSHILDKLEFNHLVDKVGSTFILYSANMITQVFIGYLFLNQKKKLDLLNFVMILLSLLNRLVGLERLWEKKELISFNFGFLIVGLGMFIYI